MASLALAQIVFNYLKQHPQEKFTARQIAEWIFATYPQECQQKKEQSLSITSDAELIQQIVAEIGSQRHTMQKRHPEVKTTEGRPRRYYYSEKSDSAEVAAAESGMSGHKKNTDTSKLDEQALYPLLSQYLWEEFGVYSKRIDEKCSSNKHGKNGNHWLHPDIVGMEDLGVNWHPKVRECASQYFDKQIRLWSFEVKLILNRSNVREYFFQAVSNSSWANFGYLVAETINDNAMQELQMLCAAHGIGLIKLDTTNPVESQIIIPARERDVIDWNMVSRLTEENSDFANYLQSIIHFCKIGKIDSTEWDIPSKK